MPLYEYQCEQCGITFEVIQKFSDHPVGGCTSCGGRVRRLLSAPAIQFKGTGWYITDYARKGSGSDAEKPGGAAGDSGAAPAPPAEPKSADSASTTTASGSTSTDKK